MKELLKIQSVQYEAGDIQIFEQVTATVKQGEVIGIIGKMELANRHYYSLFKAY